MGGLGIFLSNRVPLLVKNFLTGIKFFPNERGLSLLMRGLRPPGIIPGLYVFIACNCMRREEFRRWNRSFMHGFAKWILFG